jgi:hypothetical protein
MAMSTAARLITRMGLHRRGAHELVGSHVHSYRMLFAVSFYTEKWACLCYGAPTTLIWSAEADEIAEGLPEVSCRECVVVVPCLPESPFLATSALARDI